MKNGAGEGKNMVNVCSLIAAAGLAMEDVVPFLYSVWLSTGTALITLLWAFSCRQCFLATSKCLVNMPIRYHHGQQNLANSNGIGVLTDEFPYLDHTGQSAWPQWTLSYTSSWRCHSSEQIHGTARSIQDYTAHSRARVRSPSASNGPGRTQTSDTKPWDLGGRRSVAPWLRRLKQIYRRNCSPEYS